MTGLDAVRERLERLAEREINFKAEDHYRYDGYHAEDAASGGFEDGQTRLAIDLLALLESEQGEQIQGRIVAKKYARYAEFIPIDVRQVPRKNGPAVLILGTESGEDDG